MSADLNKVKETAQKAAILAGKLLKEHLGGKLEIHFKGEIDLVTEVDRASEELIISIIRNAFPEAAILAEEGGASGHSLDTRWVIDPLDGTTNYTHGYPFFCVSIAYEVNQEAVYGVVYDPVRDELFSAEKGRGAILNGKPIQVSQISELDKSLLCTGFPYDIRHTALNNIDCFAKMALTAQAIRRDGTAALDLCYVAAGRFDGFWEFKLKPWDIAAGALIVREAGGEFIPIDSVLSDTYNRHVLATNGRIHREMQDILKNILSNTSKVDSIK